MKNKSAYIIIGLIGLSLIGLWGVTVEFRLNQLSYSDSRVERTYDMSIWLVLEYQVDDPNPIQIEIPLAEPPKATLNDHFEISKWTYLYAHNTLNISNTPSFKDAWLTFYIPREVFNIFTDFTCHWIAEDKSNTIDKTDFQLKSPYYYFADPEIENAIWQELYNAPIIVTITLTV